MTVKQPLNPLSPQASVLAAAGVVRAPKQAGQRVAPLEDDSDKHKGRIREGHDKAFEDTFGAGSFEANVGDGRNYSGDMTITDANYSTSGGDYYESKENDLARMDAAYRFADIAMGGNGHYNELQTYSYDDYYYGDAYGYDYYDYNYQPVQYNVAYDSYGDPYNYLDTSDPHTAQAALNSHMVYGEDGAPSYYMTDTMCARPDSDTAKMFMAAKASLGVTPLDLNDEQTRTMVENATIDPENGLALTDSMCANKELTDKIMLGKAQLDGTAPSNEAIAAAGGPQQSFGPSTALKPSDILGGPEQDTQFQRAMARNVGQGSDLFFATQAMQGNHRPLAEAALDATATKTAAPLLADVEAPAPPPAALKPVAAAPAPAFMA